MTSHGRLQMIAARCPEVDAAIIEKLHNPMLPARFCPAPHFARGRMKAKWVGRQLQLSVNMT